MLGGKILLIGFTWVGLIIFFFLGCGASILNVFRAVKGMGYKVGYRDNVPSQTPELHNDDDNRR